MFLRFFCRVFIIFIFCPYHLFANEWSDLSLLLPKGTQVSYMISDPIGNKVITQSQQAILRTPASLQKLLTATAAKLYLGSEFRYETTIEGKKGNIKNKKYNGDMHFNFVGDPTLLRSDIRNMLKELSGLGIKEVLGNLYLNQSHFSGYQWSDGQPWNDLGVCYTAPANAIIINNNCVLGNLSVSSKKAKKARLFIPKYEPVSFTSDVSIVTREQRKEQFCTLEVTRNSHNQYHLWGCMVPRNQPLPLSFSVNDPFSYAQKIIASELSAVGIRLTGEVLLDNSKNSKGDILASHLSDPLDELLAIMLKHSNNLIADSLYKTVGGAYFHRPGNFRNGGEAVKQILQEQGINLENAYLADGSGLSRHNLMSAELFMSVLNYIYKNDNQLELLSSLAIAGVDGTLKHYKGTKGDLLKGKIIAKTGSMKGVVNILGVADTLKGKRLFVLIINGYNLSGSADNGNGKESKYLFLNAFFNKVMGVS